MASSYFGPKTQEANLEGQSDELDDDNWGDNEYDFEDSPKDLPDKNPRNKYDSADGMNSLSVPDIGQNQSLPSRKQDLVGIKTKEENEEQEKKGGKKN